MCQRSTAPDCADLRVSKKLGTKRYKTRVSYHLKDLGTNQDYRVFNSDINSLEMAVKERLFYVKGSDGGFVSPPEPDLKAFPDLLREYGKHFSNGSKASPLTKEEFLGAYGGRKRTIYENAFNSLLIQPLSRKDSYIKYFMKVEKVNFTAKPNAVPRGISPRDPRYHVSLGPFIKRIEKAVYKDIDRIWQGSTIMKGKNASQRGAVILHHWNSFRNPVALGIDASRFDQHVSYEALKFEHSIYLRYYKGPHRRLLERLLKWQRGNRGFGYVQDGKLKFKIRGKRASGDMNTALGNCLIMSTIIHKIIRKLRIKAKFVNDGDDGVIFLEKEDLSKLQKEISSSGLYYGFNLVVEPPVFVLEEIEFCQCKPLLLDVNKCVMVRSITNSLDKDIMSILPINVKSGKKWCRAVGDCGLSLTGGVPVLQDFYEMLRRQSKVGLKDDQQQTGFKMMAVGMHLKYKEPTAVARLSYWKAFGIPPEKQIAQEKHYQKLDYSWYGSSPHHPPHILR